MTDFGLGSKAIDAIRSLWQIRKDKELWGRYVAIVSDMKKVGANVWNPPFGSDDHRLAEQFVLRGWMKRDPAGLGGYMKLA